MPMITTPLGSVAQDTPMWQQLVIGDIRRGLSPRRAARARGMCHVSFDAWLTRGEGDLRSGYDYTQHATFLREVVLAMAESGHYARYFRQDRWMRRYWVAVGHVWLAELYD